MWLPHWTYLSEGVDCWSLMKISWCDCTIQYLCQRGWWMFDPLWRWVDVTTPFNIFVIEGGGFMILNDYKTCKLMVLPRSTWVDTGDDDDDDNYDSDDEIMIMMMTMMTRPWWWWPESSSTPSSWWWQWWDHDGEIMMMMMMTMTMMMMIMLTVIVILEQRPGWTEHADIWSF